jgi:hypothetical protein
LTLALGSRAGFVYSSRKMRKCRSITSVGMTSKVSYTAILRMVRAKKDHAGVAIVPVALIRFF